MTGDMIDLEMQKCNADGVDFVCVFCDVKKPHDIYASYTKEEWQTIQSYPRSGRVYWKIGKNGKKKYVG